MNLVTKLRKDDNNCIFYINECVWSILKKGPIQLWQESNRDDEIRGSEDVCGMRKVIGELAR